MSASLDHEAPPILPAFELAILSDIGTNRSTNEDAFGRWDEDAASTVFAIADGIGGYEGGEIASAMAVEITLLAYRENPLSWGPAKRLYRAVQRANIEIYNRALAVPELRRMGTTLTAAVISAGVLHGAHVGDCRLYLIRSGKIRQITKDHTVVQERHRMGLISSENARSHPERSALSRSLGRELIVSVDSITLPLLQYDRVILCSDGLYTVLDDAELERSLRGLDAATGCQRLIDMASERRTADNLTVAVFTMHAPTGNSSGKRGWRERIVGFFGR
jgi:PPM family protein phosphatase